MTAEEYNKKKELLNQEHKEKLSLLALQYAEENSPYKVGDIIEDYIGQGRIIKCILTQWGGNPTMRYKCDNLTKKGTINKREPIRFIHQENVKRKV